MSTPPPDRIQALADQYQLGNYQTRFRSPRMWPFIVIYLAVGVFLAAFFLSLDVEFLEGLCCAVGVTLILPIPMLPRLFQTFNLSVTFYENGAIFKRRNELIPFHWGYVSSMWADLRPNKQEGAITLKSGNTIKLKRSAFPKMEAITRTIARQTTPHLVPDLIDRLHDESYLTVNTVTISADGLDHQGQLYRWSEIGAVTHLLSAGTINIYQPHSVEPLNIIKDHRLPNLTAWGTLMQKLRKEAQSPDEQPTPTA